MDTPSKLTLGNVSIEWDASYPTPIGDSVLMAGWHVTLCELTYRYGRYSLVVPDGYLFDGASIPWLFTWLPGFAKCDWHLLAACPHDFICEHPEELPRPVGDGIFVSVLIAIAEHRIATAKTKREIVSRNVQAWLMYLAVVGFTIWGALRRGKVQLV